MDAVAKAILDIASADAPSILAINIVHPRPVSWSSIIFAIRDALIREKHLAANALRVVPFRDWVDLVEKHANQSDTRDIPAVKLLDFFRHLSQADEAVLENTESGGFAMFSTTKAQMVSTTMSELSPLTADDAGRWVKYWIDAGF